MTPFSLSGGPLLLAVLLVLHSPSPQAFNHGLPPSMAYQKEASSSRCFQSQQARRWLPCRVFMEGGGGSSGGRGDGDATLSFHVAPMQCYTNRFFRFFIRKLSSKAVLWTEMEKVSDLLVSDDACERRLRHSSEEGHVILQLGGSDPEQMGRAAALSRRYGFAAVNINCGCPSIETGGSSSYGASLMADARLVRELCDAASSASGTECSVKCRVGTVDRIEDLTEEGCSYHQLQSFVDEVASGNSVRSFSVHARGAVLGGLSPSKNRLVPPLQHAMVHRLARDRQHLGILLNGGLTSVEHLRAAAEQRSGIEGVMAGRWLLERPLDAALIDDLGWIRGGPGGGRAASNRAGAIDQYRMYAERELATKTCSLSDALTPLVLACEQLRDEHYNKQHDQPTSMGERELQDAIEALWDATGALTGTKGRPSGLDEPGLKKASLALKKKMGTKVYNKVVRNRGELTTDDGEEPPESLGA